MVAILLGFSGCLNAGDWPEFRGPTGQGLSVATNVPIHWSQSNNVAWKTAIPGEGWSSPVLARGKLFLTTAVPTTDGGGLSLRTLALDANTGRIDWDTEVFRVESGTAPGIHRKNSQASPTPLVAGDRIFVHFGHLGTACLDFDGKIRWQQTSLKYPPVHGNGGSPILVDDSLFFSCDGGSDPFVVALAADTGEVRWKTPRTTPASKKFSFSTALLITNGARREIISPGSGAVCAYDPSTGRELWRVRYGEGYSVVPRPVFAHGLLFLGTGYDRPSLLAVRPGGEGDLTETHIGWQTTRSAPNTPSAVVVGNEVYFVSDGGTATCADAQTGKVHWNERLSGDFSASPVAAEGRIYFQSEDGIGIVVKASPKFEVLARNDLSERSLSSYAVTDGGLFIRTQGHLYRIGNPAL
ncbi:MAG TPA: serine/threonine protein kinase [Verrucomicrobiales bacterium]|nr:serine/threonine protein kinase [Verrucomicrobiales bacterium]